MICGVPFPDGHLLKPHAFEVRPRNGDTSEPSAPEPTVSLRLVDHSFELSEPLVAGKHLIRVENVGVEPHEVILVKLVPGKTVDDLQVWVRNPTGEAEPPITEVSGVTALATGAEAYFEADLSAGDYVLFCMIPSYGRPHIEYGMIQHIHIG